MRYKQKDRKRDGERKRGERGIGKEEERKEKQFPKNFKILSPDKERLGQNRYIYIQAKLFCHCFGLFYSLRTTN